MAEYINTLGITEKADADLSAKQYFLVKKTATGVALAGANERVLGPLMDKPASGAFGAVQVAGIAKVKAAAAIAVNDYIKSDAAGKAVAAGGEAAGVLVEACGIALEAAAADGDVISVLLTRVVINRAAT